MDESKQVAAVLVQMGADQSQALVMAKQLIKRAEQISRDQGVEKVQALARLLELVRSGRSGESYESPDSKGAEGPQ